MASLTIVAYQTRRTLKFGFLGLIAFFVLKFALQTGWQIYRHYFPLPPPPPNVKFGKLPAIIFPDQKKTEELKFKLETPTGYLPELSSVLRVYFIPRYISTFADLDRAKQQAEKFGFRQQPQPLADTRYLWTNLDTPVTTLEIEIKTGNFKLVYDYPNDQELFAEKSYLPNQQLADQEGRNLLLTNGLLKDDLATGSAEITYLRFGPDTLTPVASLSEADFVRLNLFRTDIDNLKILPPDPRKASINFLFSGSRKPGKRIVEINYNYFPIEKEIFATYPVKSVKQAWEEFNQQHFYLVNRGQSTLPIAIRRISLAYYDSPEKQNYLQPIYVFEDDKNFLAYLPALDVKWVETATQNSSTPTPPVE